MNKITSKKVYLLCIFLIFLICFFQRHSITKIINDYVKLQNVIEEEFLSEKDIQNTLHDTKITPTGGSQREIIIETSQDNHALINSTTKIIRMNYQRSITSYKAEGNPHEYKPNWDAPQNLIVTLVHDTINDNVSIEGLYYHNDAITKSVKYNAKWNEQENNYSLFEENYYDLPFFIEGVRNPNKSAPPLLFTPHILGYDTWDKLLSDLQKNIQISNVYEEDESITLGKFIKTNHSKIMKLTGQREVVKLSSNSFKVVTQANGHHEIRYTISHPQKGNLEINMIIDMVKSSEYTIDIENIPYISNDFYEQIMITKHETNPPLPFSMGTNVFIDAIRRVEN